MKILLGLAAVLTLCACEATYGAVDGGVHRLNHAPPTARTY